MPPTYSPWWKPFEILGRIGLGRRKISLGSVALGPPGGSDCFGGEEWRGHATAEKLHDLWGPPVDSPWSGYHRPTLFAALDSVPPERLWPAGASGLDVMGAPRLDPRWLTEDVAVVLDLPGEVSVAYAAWMAQRDGHAPVATFNNWPHEKGLVDAGRVLAAMLHYTPWVRQAWGLSESPARAPPTFMLDRRRLGARPPVPKDFDNRYCLLETDLPSAATLAERGIAKLVYAYPEGQAEPYEMDDVNAWLHDLNERVAVHVAAFGVDGWRMGEPVRYAPPVRKTPFTTTKDPAFRGFRRNAAGGFGVLVPEPSSGGG